MDHNNILAVVLAGGKSKRFGRDKSQVKLGNKRLIDYILNEIEDIYNDILIVTNEPIKFLNSNKISITSDIKKDLGPLGGLFSAMKWARDNKKDYKWISTFPIDTAFFKKEHLIKFRNQKEKTPFEFLEDLEINRFLEMDIPVKCIELDNGGKAVDTKYDLEEVRKIIINKSIF